MNSVLNIVAPVNCTLICWLHQFTSFLPFKMAEVASFPYFKLSLTFLLLLLVEFNIAIIGILFVALFTHVYDQPVNVMSKTKNKLH